MAAHPIVHVEIPAHDTKAAADFYAKVFGWKIQHDPTFDYHMFSSEGGPGGGFVSMAEEHGSGGGPLVYMGTDSIEGSLEQIEANGGKRLEPKMEIPGMGWFAIFADPSGNRMALYQEINVGA